MTRYYKVKGEHLKNTFVEVVSEKPAGFDVKIINKYEDYETVRKDFLTHELFDICLRTGYLLAEDRKLAQKSA